MTSKKRKRAEPPATVDFKGDEEEQAKEPDEVVDKAGDIYDEKQMDEMLEDGEITAGEYGFMEGRESERKKKRILVDDHKDTPSVEMAEDDANEAD
jgi:hypothetical protein